MAQSVIIMQKLKGKGAISQNLFMYVEEDRGQGRLWRLPGAAGDKQEGDKAGDKQESKAGDKQRIEGR